MLERGSMPTLARDSMPTLARGSMPTLASCGKMVQDASGQHWTPTAGPPPMPTLPIMGQRRPAAVMFTGMGQLLLNAILYKGVCFTEK